MQLYVCVCCGNTVVMKLSNIEIIETLKGFSITCKHVVFNYNSVSNKVYAQEAWRVILHPLEKPS